MRIHILAPALAAVLFCLGSCDEAPTEPTLAGPDRGSSAFDQLAADYLGHALPDDFSEGKLAPDDTTPVFGGRDPHHPHGDGGRFPLEVGNRWKYRRIFSMEIILPDEETINEVIRSRVDRELIGVEQLFERDYVVQQSVFDEGELGTTTEWTRYRQDRDGLFEADVSTTEPPVLDGEGSPGRAISASVAAETHLFEQLRARGDDSQSSLAFRRAQDELQRKLLAVRQLRAGLSQGKDVLDNELTRLAYPLHSKASWTIREDPFFGSTVEGLQVVRIHGRAIPAWRIRLDSEVFGPEDRVVVWVGRVGFVGMAARIQSVATNEVGEEIGVFRARERELLRDFDLHKPRRGGRDRS